MLLTTCSAWYCRSGSLTHLFFWASFHCSAAAVNHRFVTALCVAFLEGTRAMGSYKTRKLCLDKGQKSLYHFPFMWLADPIESCVVSAFPIPCLIFFFFNIFFYWLAWQYFTEEIPKIYFYFWREGGKSDLHACPGIISLRCFLITWSTLSLYTL